jgi:Mn-dependent DtxR family transcriptional regulator
MEKLSPPIEDYLKTIYLLHEREGAATTTGIASVLEVTPASVTGMVKKLAELKLVRHTPYQGVELTKSGEKIALEMVRHHRLLELFLTEALGYSWDEVHAEADVLEHVISEEFDHRRRERTRPARHAGGRIRADHAHQRHSFRDAALRRQPGTDAGHAPYADRNRALRRIAARENREGRKSDRA